jgi:hypothetical protein
MPDSGYQIKKLSGIRHLVSGIKFSGNMYKIQLYIAILFLGLCSSSYAQMFEFSPKDASKLPMRRLLVVLQEEQPEMLNRLKKDEVKLARYKALIQYSNSILKKAVLNFWRAGQPIRFVTLEECLKISDTSQSFITLEFTSLRQNENVQLHHLKTDTSTIYEARRELMRRKEYGFFELKLIERFRGASVYTFVTPSSAPNEYDFITAVQFISALTKEKFLEPKMTSKDYEQLIQQDNKKLVNRVLLADTNVLTKHGKSFDYIRQEYDSMGAYQLSDPKGIVEKIYSGDTNYAYLNIVPYIDPIARGQSFLGTGGGNINDYDKTVYYIQFILDVASGDVLYYDKSQENIVNMRDWKKYLRASKEKKEKEKPSSELSPQEQKKPEKTKTLTPQQHYQNQYQQNQY